MSSIQNNSNDFLKEYRCTCGKLLFKGLLLVSVIEIKCKRCGNTILFKDAPKSPILVSFILIIDMDGIVTDACQAASIALAYSRPQLIGSQIKDICPLLCDSHKTEEMHAAFNNRTPYDIKQNVFLTHDGNRLPGESHCIGSQSDNVLGGYRMFNWVGKGS